MGQTTPAAKDSQSRKQMPIDSIYQGITLKFDLGNAIYQPLRNKGKVQEYELSLSAQIINKLFPTFEIGYSQAELSRGKNSFSDKGGFMRLGLDYSVLRKYKGDNHLLVGFRVGTSLQDYKFNLSNNSAYWESEPKTYTSRFGADAWGEIVAGVKVQIYKGLNMGWFLRYKILITRGQELDGIVRPAYILGYGQRNESTFGWNYYIGWTF